MSFDVVADPVFEEHTFAPDEHSRTGPVVSAFEVEYALAQCVREWMPRYLAEAEAQRDLAPGDLPELRSVVTSTDASKFPEEQLPALLVSSPGLEDAPDVRGDGLYSARWRADCTVVCSARGNRQARRLAAVYVSAVRALLVQQALFSDVLDVIAVDWRGETYRSRTADDERTRAEATVQLRVQIAGAMNRFGGTLGVSEDVSVEVRKVRKVRDECRDPA